MKLSLVLALLLLASFAYGFGLELLTAETPTIVDVWFNLVSALVLPSTIIVFAARFSGADTWATLRIAAAGAAVTAIGLTLGLWTPFVLSLGGRDVDEWLPGEYNIAMVVLWDGLMGGVLGIPLGFMARLFQRRVNEVGTL